MAEDKVRLLICAVCKSVEELPPYEGPQERDDTGNYKVSFHRFPSGNYHPFTVGDVQASAWANKGNRTAILQEISRHVEGLGEAGLGAEFYDVKANFGEDAIACWKRHGRPGSQHKNSCEDYKHDRMRLLPDTRAERKAEGLNPKSRPNTFLCQFCPYHRVVEDRVRAAQGYYHAN